MADVKVNSKHLIKARPPLAFIMPKVPGERTWDYLISEAEYTGDKWVLICKHMPGRPPDKVFQFHIPDQFLMLTDDNLYIVTEEHGGHMAYLSFFRETPRSSKTAYTVTEVATVVSSKMQEIFIEPNYIDSASLTEREFEFLRNVACRAATPVLDGSNSKELGRFVALGLLNSDTAYVGNGTNMTTYWMKPEYHKYFEFRPLKFRAESNVFNTKDLIEVSDIRGLGTTHQQHEIYLAQNDYQGKPEWSSRVRVTNVRREDGVWVLTASYRGFLTTWKIADQEVMLSDRGTCLVVSVEASPLFLQFVYTAPASPAIMRQVISGDQGWDELQSPEQ